MRQANAFQDNAALRRSREQLNLGGDHRVSKQASSVPVSFALEIRVRGQTSYLHRQHCTGLEDAVRIGRKWFMAFQARNPWFVQDSKRKRIFILLDPETESLLRQ